MICEDKGDPGTDRKRERDMCVCVCVSVCVCVCVCVHAMHAYITSG